MALTGCAMEAAGARANGDEIEKPLLLLPTAAAGSRADTKRTIAISEKDSKMDEVSRSQRRKERARGRDGGREGRWIYINENVLWDKAREGNQMPRRLVILLYFCFPNDFYLQCVDSPSLPSPPFFARRSHFPLPPE